MSRLSLVPYDSPVLRGHAYKVQKVDKHIRYIMDGLVETCYETNPRCFALSAPQICISKRIIVVPYHDQLIPIANPRIIKMSGLQRYIEGCGTVDLNPSINGYLRGFVDRFALIKMVGLDYNGRPIEIEAQGLEAQIDQHEIDHLDGILFTDKMKDPIIFKSVKEIDEFRKSEQGKLKVLVPPMK